MVPMVPQSEYAVPSTMVDQARRETDRCVFPGRGCYRCMAPQSEYGVPSTMVEQARRETDRCAFPSRGWYPCPLTPQSEYGVPSTMVDQARRETDRCVFPSRGWYPWPLSLSMGCHPPWWIRHGERLIGVCFQAGDGTHGPSVRVWGAIHHGGSGKERD